MRDAQLSPLLGPERCAGCGVRAGILCRTCRMTLVSPQVRAPQAVDRVVAACTYEGAARGLVLRCKLTGRRAAAEAMAELLHAAVVRSAAGASSLCWVPGRTRETRRRGFDHAQLLAQHLARRLGLPAHPYLGRLDERVDDQTGLSAEQRVTNLRRAFAADGHCEGRIGLVDDVITTGATASACARALRAAGASAVEMLCFSATPFA